MNNVGLGDKENIENQPRLKIFNLNLILTSHIYIVYLQSHAQSTPHHPWPHHWTPSPGEQEWKWYGFKPSCLGVEIVGFGIICGVQDQKLIFFVHKGIARGCE